jgi:hypothetical protein
MQAFQPIPQKPQWKNLRRSGSTPAGVCESPKHKADKLAFLAESSRQANELTKQRQLRQAYTKFFKTEDGRAFARSFGKSIPTRNGDRTRYGCCTDDSIIGFCDPADLPRASVSDHPIDHIEPAEDFRPLDGLTPEEIKLATSIFESSMRWCIEISGLVDKGLRSMVVISIMRPDLSGGLKIDKRAARVFKRANAGANGAMELTGKVFGPVLEWIRCGNRISELGERIMMLIYVLRPDLVDGNTLAELGKITNKTRQAKDKLANCLRDTYSNIKTHVMRGNVTRTRCRIVKRSQPINYANNY